VYEYLDWTKLPPDLAYLAGPAEKYGHYQIEDKIFDFLRTMSEDDKRELTALLAPRTEGEAAQLEEWLDKYRITKHPEARLVYFLGYLLALANEGGFLSTSATD
jgi:hypothetical protein